MTQQPPIPEPLPAWLEALVSPAPPSPDPSDIEINIAALARLRKQDMLALFEALFEPAMEALTEGTSINKFLRDDPRQPHPGKFMRWIMDDPARYQTYQRANEVAMELISNDIIPIADGKDEPMEDVARTKLRVDARKTMMAFNNKRFVSTTKVDVTGHQTISLVGLMKDRERIGLQMVERLNNLAPQISDATVKPALPLPTTDPTTTDDEDDD